jgi:putative ABC transport system permease protein
MVTLAECIHQSTEALRAHKLRATLTVLGLTMGVATLITVMTIVQGANLYVEQKIANLGTDVFQVARMPFATTDFNLIIKAQRYKHIEYDDYLAVAGTCGSCDAVGASADFTTHVRYENNELVDIDIIGHTANMADIDTRTVEHGRYFTPVEDEHGAKVCLIGDTLREHLFPSIDPIGKTIRVGSDEFQVIGTFEKIGSVLGQDQDNFAIIPLRAFLKMRGNRSSLILNIHAAGERRMQAAQDEVRMVLRARRHVAATAPDDFFIATKESYIALWQSISSAFFSVFIMVSSISAVVGGIVIMNVMLVSVTERTKEIGIRRAMGATKRDILRQFLTESVMQCVIGGVIGVGAGFLFAMALRTFTSFPASVKTWVAVLGVVLSSMIGLFFGIYPATRAAKLDPVVALRTE